MIEDKMNTLKEDGKVYVSPDIIQSLEERLVNEGVGIIIIPLHNEYMVELDLPEERGD